MHRRSFAGGVDCSGQHPVVAVALLTSLASNSTITIVQMRQLALDSTLTLSYSDHKDRIRQGTAGVGQTQTPMVTGNEIVSKPGALLGAPMQKALHAFLSNDCSSVHTLDLSTNPAEGRYFGFVPYWAGQAPAGDS